MGEGGSSPPWTALQYQRFSIDPQPLQASVEGEKVNKVDVSVRIRKKYKKNFQQLKRCKS